MSDYLYYLSLPCLRLLKHVLSYPVNVLYYYASLSNPTLTNVFGFSVESGLLCKNAATLSAKLK